MKKNIIALVLFTIFWFLVYLITNMFTAGFWLLDDHQVPQFAFYLEDHNFFETIGHYLTQDFDKRFRPFYFIHRIVEYMVFEDKWILWHTYTYFLAVVTSFFLYLFGKNIKFNFMESILFSFLALVGLQSTIWARLGPNETLGMLLLSISLYLISLNRQTIQTKIALIILIILMSMSKESFLITIPAVLFLFSKLHSFKNNISFNLILLSVFITEILIIIFFVGTQDVSYAGVDVNRISLMLLYKIFTVLIYNSQLLFVIKFLFGFWLAIFTHNFFIAKNRKLQPLLGENFSLVWIFAILLIIPQLVLHAKSGWLVLRYINPSMVAISLVVTYTFHHLTKYIFENYKPLVKYSFISVMSVVILLVTSAKTILCMKMFKEYSQKCVITTRIINQISSKYSGKTAKILLVANEEKDGELIFAIKQFLRYYSDKNTDYTYIVTDSFPKKQTTDVILDLRGY